MSKQRNPKRELRQQRYFSEQVRKQVVADIEKGRCTVAEASRELGVSDTAIYQWLHKYSIHLKKNKALVVQDKSEAYRTTTLEAQLKAALAALGSKQMEIDLLNKIIELASESYGTDLKKTIQNPPSSGSVKPRGNNTTST